MLVVGSEDRPRAEDAFGHAGYERQQSVPRLQIEHLQAAPAGRVEPAATVLREGPVPTRQGLDERSLFPVVDVTAVLAHEGHSVCMPRHRDDSVEALNAGELGSGLLYERASVLRVDHQSLVSLTVDPDRHQVDTVASDDDSTKRFDRILELVEGLAGWNGSTDAADPVAFAWSTAQRQQLAGKDNRH